MRLPKDFKEFTAGKGVSKKIATILLNPCFHCVCLFRLSNMFYRIHLSFISKIIWYINRLLFHADIDYRADLAGGFVLVHGLGTVIGMNVISKGRLKVYQGVTIGGNSGKTRVDSEGKVFHQPVFEDDVIIYTNAGVYGPIEIKSGTVIKAGEIVSHSIL